MMNTPSTNKSVAGRRESRHDAQLSVRQLNLLRVGYVVMGGGLAVFKWPLLFDGRAWELKEGTVQSMLVAMSVLALLGIRYPRRMLPVLLFEVGWKLTWLATIALPLWSDDNLHGATREQAGTVLWVVIIIAVVPWRHALSQYALASSEPWRQPR